MLQARMNYEYTKSEFNKLGLETMNSFCEPIGFGNITIYGRGYARFLVNRKNGNYVISFMC